MLFLDDSSHVGEVGSTFRSNLKAEGLVESGFSSEFCDEAGVLRVDFLHIKHLPNVSFWESDAHAFLLLSFCLDAGSE